MKIIFHHRIRSKDGQFVHMQELIAAFRDAGHEVVIVGPEHIASSEFGADGGFASALRQHLPRAIYEILELSYAIPAFFRLLIALWRESPTFIYERYNLFFPAGIWAAKTTGVPLVLEINAPLFEERSKYNGIALAKLARWTESMTWRGADHVLPVTEVLAQKVRSYGVAAVRTTVVQNAISGTVLAPKHNPSDVRQKWQLGCRCVIGFIGFIRAWHGLDQVIHYMAQRRELDLHFLIAGNGPVRTELQVLAKRLEIDSRVTFAGIVSREEVSDYLRAFDVAVQPAVVAYASPLKLFEYMAAGCAIVAPDSANIREVLENNIHALLFDAGEKRSFVDALDQLVGNRTLRQRLGGAARKRIEELDLTWSGNVRRIVTLPCVRERGAH